MPSDTVETEPYSGPPLMPTHVTPWPILDWFLFGFFAGFGWSIIAFFTNRALSRMFP